MRCSGQIDSSYHPLARVTVCKMPTSKPTRQLYVMSVVLGEGCQAPTHALRGCAVVQCAVLISRIPPNAGVAGARLGPSPALIVARSVCHLPSNCACCSTDCAILCFGRFSHVVLCLSICPASTPALCLPHFLLEFVVTCVVTHRHCNGWCLGPVAFELPP